jgi:hypothetical protein
MQDRNTQSFQTLVTTCFSPHRFAACLAGASRTQLLLMLAGAGRASWRVARGPKHNTGQSSSHQFFGPDRLQLPQKFSFVASCLNFMRIRHGGVDQALPFRNSPNINDTKPLRPECCLKSRFNVEGGVQKVLQGDNDQTARAGFFPTQFEFSRGP